MLTSNVNVADATGLILDYLVAYALKHKAFVCGVFEIDIDNGVVANKEYYSRTQPFSPSSDWNVAGPLADKFIHGWGLHEDPDSYYARIHMPTQFNDTYNNSFWVSMSGLTYQEAALRAIVVAHFRKEIIEIPTAIFETLNLMKFA